MPRLPVLTLLAGSILTLGCGPTTESGSFNATCTEGPDTIVAALRAAPGEARLSDGTPISACVDGASSDADLQNVGVALTAAAERLEERAASDPRAALELGYLVGAARRGAGSASAIQAELVRRLERSADLEGATADAERELGRGMAAGLERG